MLRLTLIGFLLLLSLAACQDKKRSLAMSKIKEASKLATTRTELSKFIFATQEKKFLGIFKLNDSRFAAKTKAYVLAGVDLSKISEYDVHATGDRISLVLPTVEVLDFSYPFKEYKIDYSITDQAFANTISVESHEELYRRAESQIREILPHTGIQKATELRTRQLLESLLKGLGYTEIYISFKPGNLTEDSPLKDEDFR